MVVVSIPFAVENRIRVDNAVYLTAHDNTGVGGGLDVGEQVAHYFNAGSYTIERLAAVFDTSGIPAVALISSAKLKWWLDGMLGTIRVRVHHNAAHPANPIVKGDYWKDWYDPGGIGGSLDGPYTFGAYNDIPLNATGITWIVKGGETRFILRDRDDIDAVAPIGVNQLANLGANPMLLEVTYTLPLFPPGGGSRREMGCGRAFFNDDGSSGDKLVREWNQTTPAAWSSTYLTPHPVYKYTTVGAINYCTLMSERDRTNFDVEVLFKATNADAMMGLAVRKARTLVNDVGQVCFWLTGGVLTMEFTTTSGATPVLSAPAYVVDITKWHRMRVRCVGRNYKCKVWPDDTAEPDWMIAQYVRYREIRMGGIIALRSGIRTVYFTNVIWTPVPRTGGP